MRRGFTASRTSIRIKGRIIYGAQDRQNRIPGFDPQIFSRSKILCVGAGGIISHVAPTLVRKGIGRVTLLDGDIVDVSNLNRQRFYKNDIGSKKAITLARNLKQECIAATEIRGYAFRFEEAVARRINLSGDVVICGVDNNPARVEVSRYFFARGIPVIFTAVSADGDHGYVFVQGQSEACIGCLFPDMVNDDRFPCPGTPAIADILQAVGSLAGYAVDTLLMNRPRAWNYRRLTLSDGEFDGATQVLRRNQCSLCVPQKQTTGEEIGNG